MMAGKNGKEIQRPVSAEVFLNQLSADHVGKKYGRNEVFRKDLEYFLKLVNVPGFSEKKKEFEDGGDDQIKWYSLCAELRAIATIGRNFSLEITGFEQASPVQPCVGTAKHCDISARFDTVQFFFEVKAKSSEASLAPPDFLRKYLETLPWSSTVTVHRLRSRSPEDWDATFERLKAHICAHNLQIIPRPYDDGLVRVSFLARPDRNCVITSYEPDSEKDIEKWLLGDLSDPEKKPMVRQAVAKGADFLVAQIPGWYDFPYLFPKIFSKVARINTNVFCTDDSRISCLKGIIIFTASHDFAFVGSGAVPGFLSKDVKLL